MAHKRTQARTHLDTSEFAMAEERGPIRVLILEDVLDISEALSLVLSLDEGFEIEDVHDVATCLERLEESAAGPDSDQSRTFDVLLLDILLGSGSWGTEVLKA